MKKNSLKALSLLSILTLICTAAIAQQDKETEIKTLDNLEREAVLKGDSVALFTKFWSPQMVVNTPANRVGTVEGTIAALRAGKLNYASFERNVERITFIDNIAVVMGEEIIKPQGLSDNVGKTVTRRFTNIWMSTKDGWRIVARHATIIKIE